MITSVEEAIEDTVTEVFADWVDCDRRAVLWDHHASLFTLHEQDCPDGGECSDECGGLGTECCCDHEVSHGVSMTITLITPDPDTKVAVPKTYLRSLWGWQCATPVLDQVIRSILETHEKWLLLRSVDDVDEQMRQLLRDGEQG